MELLCLNGFQSEGVNLFEASVNLAGQMSTSRIKCQFIIISSEIRYVSNVDDFLFKEDTSFHLFPVMLGVVQDAGRGNEKATACREEESIFVFHDQSLISWMIGLQNLMSRKNQKMTNHVLEGKFFHSQDNCERASK